MATREDQHHAWGGQFLWQNIKALAVSRIYRGALPMGILDTYAFSLEAEELEQSSEINAGLNSVLFRQATSFRLAQLMTDFDPVQPKVKTALQIKFQEQLKKNDFSAPDTYFFQFASMLILGINDLNITRENLMLDGSIIDYEDISFLGNQNIQSTLVNIKVMNKPELKAGCSLDDLGDEVYLFTSNFSVYLDGLRMTMETLNRFLDQEIFPVDQCAEYFLKFLRLIHEEIYEMDESFFTLMKALSTMKGSYIEGHHYFQMKADPAMDLIKLLKTYGHEVRKINYETDQSVMAEIRVDFPKGKWRNSKLAAYYKSLPSHTVDDVATILFKKLQMEFILDKNFKDRDCFTYSSFADETLSGYAWIFPYHFNQSVEFKTSTLEQELDHIKTQMNFEDMKISALSGHLVNENSSTHMELSTGELKNKLQSGGEFVLKGVILELPGSPRHFVALHPKWIRT